MQKVALNTLQTYSMIYRHLLLIGLSKPWPDGGMYPVTPHKIIVDALK